MKQLSRMFTALVLVLASAASTHADTKKVDTMQIVPSATSSKDDFNFLVGKWKVANRMIASVSDTGPVWTEFVSELHMRKVLDGMGNVENFYADNNGTPYEGMAVRLFNPKTKLWSVYWMDTNWMTMDGKPVVGSFDENKLGRLYANDIVDGAPVVYLYQWDAADPEHPKWSQAMSKDGGQTWEFNWYMTLTRIE